MPGKCQCQLTCQSASLSWWHHNPSVHFYFPVKVNSICCSETWFTLTGYLKLSSTVFYLIPNVFFFYFSHLPLPQIVSPSILKSHYPNNSGYIGRDKIETGRQAGKTKPCSTSRKHGWQNRQNRCASRKLYLIKIPRSQLFKKKKAALQLSYQAHLGLQNSPRGVCLPGYPPTSRISESLKVKQQPSFTKYKNINRKRDVGRYLKYIFK